MRRRKRLTVHGRTTYIGLMLFGLAVAKKDQKISLLSPGQGNLVNKMQLEFCIMTSFNGSAGFLKIMTSTEISKLLKLVISCQRIGLEISKLCQTTRKCRFPICSQYI